MNNPPTETALDLLKRAEALLSALHGSVARHDNLAANLGCAGCELRDQIRGALPTLAAAPSPAPAARPTPDSASPIAGRIEVREPCPWCPDRPMVPRSLMDEHVARLHPDVQTVEASPAGLVAVPPATALRELIVDVIRRFPFDDFGLDDVSYLLEAEPDAQEWVPKLAAAVLAVLPAGSEDTTTTRADTLREAADAVFALDYDVMVGEVGDENLGSMREAWDLGTIHANKLLRRLAEESAVTPPPALTEVGRLRAQVEVLQQDAERDRGLAKVGARCMRDGHQGLIEQGRAVIEGWRFALSTALDLGTGAPWEAIHERVKELRRLAAETQPDTQAPRPQRGDAVESWLKAQRDEYHQTTSPQWIALDEVLDAYRLHADMGEPLDGHVCEGRVVGDCERLETPAPVHVGGGANAEDCPACPGTNPPYPFHCPGNAS